MCAERLVAFCSFFMFCFYEGGGVLGVMEILTIIGIVLLIGNTER